MEVSKKNGGIIFVLLLNSINVLSGVALVLGGTYGNKSGILQMHQLSKSRLCTMPESFNLPVARKEHAAITLDKYLVVCGGVEIKGSNATEEDILSDSCNLLDPSSAKWYQLPAMPTALAGAASVSSSNKFYLLGGRTKEGPSNKVLVFDQMSKQWFEGVGLSAARYGACAVIKNGVVVVTGGANSQGYLSSVEMYDTRTGEGWVALPNMTLSRAMHGCAIASKKDLVSVNDNEEDEEEFLLVAGGSGQSNETSTSVEAISFKQSQSGWVQIRPLGSNRYRTFQKVK